MLPAPKYMGSNMMAVRGGSMFTWRAFQRSHLPQYKISTVDKSLKKKIISIFICLCNTRRFNHIDKDIS